MQEHVPSSARCRQCGGPLAVVAAASGVCPACALEQGLAADPAPAPLPFSRCGDYELLEEIARGGMGVVYRARQLKLNRTVAVKMILAGHFASAAELRRFRAEARAAAALQHPGIVAIHEVGEHEGLLYFSMDYVEGRNLAQLLRAGPLPPARAAELLRAIARAIHYAHERGVLHRDLKPSNVLLDEHGQPRVTDFGLAKHFSGAELATPSAELTLTGQVLGSPNFMPPEQAAGKHREVTPAADIYALGALLYHCATSRPPFLADSVPETLRLAAETDPVAPRLLNPTVPRDLETICLKCLEKNPARRYATAQELAEELDRFLGDQPIHARPAGRGEKFLRWCRRHPALASVSALAGLLIAAVVTISTTSAIRLERANTAGQEKLWQSYLAQARANRWSDRPGRRFKTLETIRQAVAIRPSLELRNEAVAALAQPDMRVLKVIQNGTNALEFSRDFQRYFQQSPDGRFHFRRTTDDQTFFTWEPPSGGWSMLNQSWSGDGRYCAIALMRSTTYHLEVLDLERRRSVLSRSNYWVRTFDFSAGGQMLAVGRTNNLGPPCLEMFELHPELTLRRSTKLSVLPYGVRFDPSGRRLALSSTESRRIQILDASTGERLREFSMAQNANGLDWSPDGRRLAVGGSDGLIYIWDTEGVPAPPLKLRHGDVVTQVSFAPSGNWLVSGGWDNQMRIWNLTTGQQAHHEQAHYQPVFSARDQTLAYSASTRDRTLGEFVGAEEYRELPCRVDRKNHRFSSFSPDGRILAVPDHQGVRLLDPASGLELAGLPGVNPDAALFSPSGDWLVARFPTRLQFWQIEPGASNVAMQFAPGIQVSLQGSSGTLATDQAGKFLSLEDHGAIRVIETATGRDVLPRSRQTLSSEPWFRVTLTPDGRFCLASLWSGRQTFAWEIESAAPARPLSFPLTSGFAHSSDGRLLVTGSGWEYAGWEGASFAPRWRFERPATGNTHPRLALATRASLGAATFSVSTIRLFDPEDGKELATLETPGDALIQSLALAPHGDRLAVLTPGKLAIWNLRAIRRQLAALNLDWPAAPLPPALTSAPPVIVVQKNSETNLTDQTGQDFPPRDPAGTNRHIDLGRHFNARLDQSWFNPAWAQNNLSGLSPGLQTLDGIAFDLRGIIQLAGTELGLSERYPSEVSGLVIGQKTPALHFLHATGWEPPVDTHVGDYVLRYEDGQELRVPLRYAGNIRVWSRFPKDSVTLAPGSAVAWRGWNPYSRSQGWQTVLYRFRLENPRPEVAITSVDFVSAMTKAAPFLLAITAE